MSLVEVSEEGAFNHAVQSSNKDLLVAYFWAGFHEACQKGGQIDQVLGVLQTRYGNVDFLKADAEALGDVAEKFGVSMVPSFVFIKNGQKVDLTEGANPVNLQNAIEKNLKSSSGSVTGNSEDPTIEKIKRLIASSHVILFMKGSPAEPRCKFSRAMVELLNEQNVKFASFDILSDQDLREKLKTVSNWPTYPQLYVGGKLIGGLDAVKELAATDDGKGLRDIISKDVVAPPRVAKRPPTVPGGGTQREVNDEYLKELTTSSPVVLFMKGSPDEPSCGFSSKIVNLLREQKITFSSFDILQDQQVREKLKTFANWPTYPQLWVRGTLIGGLDIVQEMAEEGDLAEQLGIEPLEKRLEQLVNRAPVMLFMKGSPQEPRCGFSREMVRILDEEGTKYDTFDILEDEEVRQGLKTYSNWPTYPQLYVKGKLVGGLDIVKELKEEDELKETLAPSQL